MKKIKIKNNQLVKFDSFTGITKINEKYYVYFDYSGRKLDYELGNVIGEGNTAEEALINSVKNINKRMIKWAKRVERLTELLKFDPFQAWYGNPKDKNAEKRRIELFKKESCIVEEDTNFTFFDEAPNCPH